MSPSIRLLLLNFCFITSLLHAQQLPQQWLRSFEAQGKNSDRIAAIVTDANDNVFVAGYAGNHHGAADALQ
ncbi:MAG: hypothetical protein IPM91_09820 [Bacteroidetes bacterium]|nr:hypothetical protein [Bacteroidota bacterium]